MTQPPWYNVMYTYGALFLVLYFPGENIAPEHTLCIMPNKAQFGSFILYVS